MHQEWADYRVFWREFRRTFHTTGAVMPSGRALSRALTRYVRDGETLPLPLGEGRGEGKLLKTVTSSPRHGQSATLPLPPRRIFDPEEEGFGRRILEVGPGTGAVTAQIIRDMHPHDRLTLVERNDQFVGHLRQRIEGDKLFQKAAKRIELVHAGAEEISETEPFQVIVSGLPLNNFSVAFVEQIAAKLRRLLAPQGTLSFFEYVAVRKFKALVSRRDERERLTCIGRLLGDVLRTSEIKRDLVLTNIPPAWVHHVRFSRPTPDT